MCKSKLSEIPLFVVVFSAAVTIPRIGTGYPRSVQSVVMSKASLPNKKNCLNLDLQDLGFTRLLAFAMPGLVTQGFVIPPSKQQTTV
jgi:hypothetical protein